MRWMQKCMGTLRVAETEPHQDLNYYLLMLMMSRLLHQDDFLPREGESCSFLKMMIRKVCTPVLLAVCFGRALTLKQNSWL